jgi:hypothetical protein
MATTLCVMRASRLNTCLQKPYAPPSQLMRRELAGHDKHQCPARAVVQLDPLHTRPPPAVGSSCTTALHTHPAHARRGPDLNAPPALARRTHEGVVSRRLHVASADVIVGRGNRRAKNAFVNSTRSRPRAAASHPRGPRHPRFRHRAVRLTRRERCHGALKAARYSQLSTNERVTACPRH